MRWCRDKSIPRALPTTARHRHLVKILLLSAVLLLAAAAPAVACPAGTTACPGAAETGSATERRAPRIIFGETEAAEFRFRPLRPLRRSNASTRQAYFGSGETYSGSLARLQAQLQAIKARSWLEGLPLTPAQEAAKAEMPPALARALALSKQGQEKPAE